MTLLRQLGMLLRRYPKLIEFLFFFYRKRQAHFTMGVVGIVENDRGQILLVEHVFHPQIPWGLPGGWVDRHEDPQVAVVREFIEELNLRVDATEIVMLERKFGNHIDIAYRCVPESPLTDEQIELSYELIQYRWVAPDALPVLHKFHYDAIQVLHERRSEVSHVLD